MASDNEPLVGLAGYIDVPTADYMEASLRELWRVSMGRQPDDLASDLQLCRRWFDPVAQGQRLRKELSELEPVSANYSDMGPPFTLEVGPGKLVVTPEGRCALDLLARLSRDRPGWVIDDSDTAHYDRMLAHLYQQWSRHRINSVLALQAGTTKPLQIPAAGVVIALMVNGAFGAERALIRFTDDRPKAMVDEAFFPAVNAFADVLAPSRRGSRNARLISGWMLYEARRRLGDGLVVEDFQAHRNGRVWIRREKEREVVATISRDLARGHRQRVTSERFAVAFDALVEQLRIHLPSLAGLGLSHEQPTETSRLRAAFIRELSVDLGGPE